LGCLQEGSGHDDDGSGSITGFNILSFGDLNEHLGGWVNDGHLLQDGGAIVGDQNFASLILDHLVHASWTEGSSHDIGDGSGSDDVGLSDIFRFLGE
jgi:hypothetical protein